MEFIYVNDLQNKYPNKTLLEISDILKEQGIDQRRIKIRVNCKVCGCEVITTTGSYKKQKTFCCETHIKHKPNGNPIIYNENKRMLNEIQARTILKDKQKSGYIKTRYQIPILYLWESDINKNPDKCKSLVRKILDNGGVLENYHSFNYSYEKKELKLLSNLIIPYQDMQSSQYKSLINKMS